MNRNYILTNIGILLIFLIHLTSCASQKSVSEKQDFKYSIEKPIEGQLHTAKRLKTLMAEKKYEQAINLFSKKQQVDIRKMKSENSEMFNYWCLAWALDERAYEYYCTRIKNGNGMFVFEEGEWKIDEK